MIQGSRRRRGEATIVAFGALAFGGLFGASVLRHLTNQGVIWDWDLSQALAWVPYHTVVKFDQLPLWNPYLCGGIPALADPETRFITPFFLLHLLFGPLIGIHLAIPLHIAVAFAGCYLLARVLGMVPSASIACAIVFPSSSWFYLHLAVGHTTFLPYAYMPWVLALALLSVEGRGFAYAAASSATLALMVLEGGIYSASHSALLAGLVLLAIAIERRSLRPMYILLAVGIFAAGFGALKLLPSYAFVIQHPRPSGEGERVSLVEIMTALFSRDQNIYRYMAGWGFFECGAYVSAIFGTLAILGAIGSPRRSFPWLFAIVALLLLTLGNFSEYSPWALLHRLPFFSWERVSMRLLIPLTLCIGVLAGYGADFFRARLSSWTAILYLLIAAGALDAWLVGAPVLAAFVGSPEQRVVPVSATFRQFRNPDEAEYTLHMLNIIQGNVGIIGCYRYFSVDSKVVGYNQPGYKGEQYLVGPGSVELLRWSPNAIDYEIDAAGPAVLVVNQNYDPSWRIGEGRGEMLDDNGLLAVRAPAGRQHIQLDYSDHLFVCGLIISLITALATLTIVRYEHGKSGTILSAGSPDSGEESCSGEDTAIRATGSAD